MAFSASAINPLTFEVEVRKTVEDNSIDRVVLLRPAAVTHHFDADQRYIELEFNSITDQFNPRNELLIVDSPFETLGPPGWYMLFVIEKDLSSPAKRVPSVAAWIKLT